MRRLLCFATWAACLAFSTAHAGDVITVSFDIKPTSCPNPFNPPGGLLTETVPTAILGTEDLPARSFSPDGLVIVVPGGGGLLGDIKIPPIQVGFEDVATPVDDPSHCNCTTAGPDSFEDLTAKFDADDIAAALGDVWGGQQIHLCIEGLLLDGTPFRGCDCIVIVGPVSVDDGSWGRTKATYR